MTQNNNSKQPSQELLNHLIELKTTISKLKELYRAIEKKAIEEGFSSDEIYEIANTIEISTQKSIVVETPNQATITITNTTTNNNENEETKYFQKYFQHFQ